MPNCANISKNLILALCAATAAGIENEIIIGNHDDIDFGECEVSNGVISALVLKSGKHAYKYSSAKNAFECQSPLVKGTYINTFDHQVVARILTKSQDIKDELNKLSQGKVFVLVKNKSNVDDEVKYEVYGFENGLEMSDLQNPSTDTDGVIYTVSFASADGAKESQLPLSFYDTSLTKTEQDIEALLPTASAS